MPNQFPASRPCGILMSDSFPIYTVDAFSNKPFSGNPAAVCLTLEKKLDDATQLKIAAEMRHSETAFVTSHREYSESNPIFGLRWFTPTTEVPLCGHATLATAHVLFNEMKLVTGDLVMFETQSGHLKVRRNEIVLQLDFPRGFPMNVEIESTIMEDVLFCFGLSVDYVVNQAFCTQTKKLIVELARPKHVWDAKVPQAHEIMSIPFPIDVRGIALAACSSEPGWTLDEDHEALKGVDIMTRYFSPWNGIPEDPVNGSSHTLLPYYFSKKLGKNSMRSYAASARGGYLQVSFNDEEKDRVYISGSACVVLSGQIHL